MKRQNIRTLSLVIITLTYLIIGAAVFDHFESTNEKIENAKLTYNITMFKLKHKMNDTEFNRLWHNILEKKPYHAGNQWKFIGSLYFCTVVVTLIGYGHSTPRTVAGKCFCIFYTLIGIPIFLIMFQSVGERLNSLIVFIFSRIKKKFKFKNQDVSLVELITFETFFTLTITILASYIFMRNEDWSYFDSMYYCFITLTTIGFGDMVPMQKNNVLSNNFAYACFTILFILIGLTTLASSMNLLVLRLATINAEEQVAERLEAAEAAKQVVHLEGDVINPNNGRMFINQEKPEQLEQISVCSCACLDYKIWHTKRNRLNKSSSKNKNDTNQNYNDSKILSIFRKSGPVKRLILGSKSKKNALNNNLNHDSYNTNKEYNTEYEMNSTHNIYNRKISDENSYNVNDSGLNKKNSLMNSNTNIKRNSV